MQGLITIPKLKTPFPNEREFWICPKTGIKVPKNYYENLEWRTQLLKEAENDPIMQMDLLAASKESLIFWINAFAWTYHQKEIDPVTGRETPAKIMDWPFITWEIQDNLFGELENSFIKGLDLLIEKSRDMGASWSCLDFFHWIWLFKEQTELREMSRKESLVDGDADSLFWKHDYINKWLPNWMCPPGVLTKGKDNRTKLHLHNALNGSTIAGEATTGVSLSGGRAKALLLDEFAKVENGQLIRSATRDVAPCRIVNSTPFGAGTEYSRWKTSGQIKVFPLMFWEHPQKGKSRYVRKDDLGQFHIRSPWFDYEETVRSPKEIAQEILAIDIESGDMFFVNSNIEKHIVLFGREPLIKMNVILKESISNAQVFDYVKRRDLSATDFRMTRNGKLLVWTNLMMGRPDQGKSYIFGIDTSKGQGASESVVSIKCKETKEKIARWACANTPPYEFARIVIALALWCGGANPRRLPFLKWEMDGPGWDLGRMLVEIFGYPYYYVGGTPGDILRKKGKKYGWHASRENKNVLLSLYDRIIAHGGYINHDQKGLEQMRLYIHFPDGSIGPAFMVEENSSARKLHGDIVIADALTLEDDEIPNIKIITPSAPFRSFGYRKKLFLDRKKIKGWRRPFDFSKL